MSVIEPRLYAAALLLIPLAALFPLCRFLAARVRMPFTVWAAGGYLAWLHLICIYGLLTSTRFENGLALLTLFTFPFSTIDTDMIRIEGFATFADLTANYVRYVLCFGGLNALVLAGFLSLVVARRSPALAGRTRLRDR